MEILDDEINFSQEPGAVLSDLQAMKLAIAVGKKGAGFVSPNPLVGSVVLSAQGKLLSSGYHQNYGGPHAEVHAINGLSEAQLKGARVFVTLEPCAHEGKTPSCAKMLAKLPVAEVVYGLVDPNPLVQGQGAAILSAAGIKATLFKDLQTELTELCEHFLLNFAHKKIWISSKVATSLDGVLAMKSGESKWITSEAARHYTHALRGAHDAILVGVNTLLMDDPSLDIRHPDFVSKENFVIILDPHGVGLGQVANLKIAKTHKPEKIIFVTGEAVKLRSPACQVIVAPVNTENGFAWSPIEAQLWKLGIRSIFVEGGAYTHGWFLNQKLVNRLYLFQAPILLGGTNGRQWTESLKVAHLNQKVVLRQAQVKSLAPDILVTGLLS